MSSSALSSPVLIVPVSVKVASPVKVTWVR
jgi:hypothetical protein